MIRRWILLWGQKAVWARAHHYNREAASWSCGHVYARIYQRAAIEARRDLRALTAWAGR